MEDVENIDQNIKKKKKPKVYYDKYGNPMVSTAFRCPLALYELIENDAMRPPVSSSTQGIIAALSKYYGFKG